MEPWQFNVEPEGNTDDDDDDQSTEFVIQNQHCS